MYITGLTLTIYTVLLLFYSELFRKSAKIFTFRKARSSR